MEIDEQNGNFWRQKKERVSASADRRREKETEVFLIENEEVF